MILEAKPENLDRIAGLHRVVLRHTFTSQVGKSFVARLYKLLIENKPISKVFIEKEADVIKGFIGLTNDRLVVNRKVSQLLGINDKLHLLYFVLLHPRTINELYGKVRLDCYIAKHYKNRYPSILTLGVSPKYQNRGIGRTLILKADKYFKTKGFSKYFVDTETKNEGAVQFYLKLGFRPVNTISGNVILEKII